MSLLLSAVGSRSAVAAGPARLEADAPVGYERPSPETVRSETRDILSHPRFAPRVSILERFGRWLRDKLAGLRLPEFGIGGIGAVVTWIIVVWACLTLVAILIHMGWHIALLVRRTPALSSGFEGTPLDRLGRYSFKELRAMMLELAEKGRFREAISAMMAALLRRLHDVDVVILHQSKTNGDYVREFPGSHPARPTFRGFVSGFDGTIYGKARCDQSLYTRMNGLFERVLSDVGERP